MTSQSIRSDYQDNDEEEQELDSDVEDLFQDALDEIQNASTRFNITQQSQQKGDKESQIDSTA